MSKIKIIPKDKIFGIILSKLNLFSLFLIFFFFYLKRKITRWSLAFEKNKNSLVKIFMMHRGRYNRPFLHITAMFVLIAGAIFAPFLADSYPLFPSNSSNIKLKFASLQESIIVDDNVFQTKSSPKPRDKIIAYAVEKGDTLSSIARKFQISTETIKWANDLTSDNLNIGDELKILPVTGMSHKVAKGESIYTIAKKYDTNPQQIVDFPFNEFANPETFSLVEGQMLVVPDGVKPSEKPVIRRQYIVSGSVSISATGFSWPLGGVITQFSSWYHTALDLAAPIGTPIVAATNGKVIKASSGTWDGGYGTNLIIDSGTGYQTLYSHMSGFNVNIGDTVTAGKTIIGWIGMTGRTTGPHVHFEIRRGGVLVNPLPYLQ